MRWFIAPKDANLHHEGHFKCEKEDQTVRERDLDEDTRNLCEELLKLGVPTQIIGTLVEARMDGGTMSTSSIQKMRVAAL